MESLDTSIKYLAEKGLEVKKISDFRAAVSRGEDQPSTVFVDGNELAFERWMYVPGPGEDDFRAKYLNLDTLLLAVWCFYFGSPIVLSGWEIALHRRPYWSLDQVQYRLRNAVRISEPELDAIWQTRRRRAQAQPEFNGRLVGMAFASCTQFISAGTHVETRERLLIRRDAEEAYILPPAEL